MFYRESRPPSDARHEESFAAGLRLTPNSDFTSALAGCLDVHGVAVMANMVPLRRERGQEYCRPFARVLEGITFQGRSLLTPAGGLNLDVFGAAIGSAISMPLLIPGSFLAGALVGESSGYLVSVMQSMQHPTLKALLDAACSRIGQCTPSLRFDPEELSQSWSVAPIARQAKDAEAEGGNSRLGPWGSALSLLLFGPLAFKKKDDADASPSKQMPRSVAGWHMWCFYHREELTEEGVMPDVAQLMHEAHRASWHSSHDSTDLLSTDAAWRLPDLALTAATLRSAEKLWLPVLQAQLPQSSFSPAGDAEHAGDRPIRQGYSLSLKQASLLWADSSASGTSSRTWSALEGFGTRSAEGISVVVPLVDMAQDCVQLEVIAGSHKVLQGWSLPEVTLDNVPALAGDILVLDNRVWHRLRVPAPQSAQKVVLLQYEYAIESNGKEAPLHRGSTDTLFWSGVVWWLRFSKASSTTWSATAAMLPQLELWRQGT